jgi:hypothetical protein
MINLAGGPIVQLRHGVAATGDWKVMVVAVFVMAIAFGAMFLIGNRTAKPQRHSQDEPIDNDRKAA